MSAEAVDRETGELLEVREGFADARLSARFVMQRQGKPFVQYPGLLDLLHQVSEGYFAIETDVVQLPTQDNGMTAICTARVRIFDPQDADLCRRVTTGIGDANPVNVSPQMVPHLLRMAETRAKARALRDAVNVSMAAAEELGPQGGDDPPAAAPIPPPAPEQRAERIEVEGTVFTRPQVLSFYKRRVEQARSVGLVLPPGDLLPEDAPLPLLVGASQGIRKRLEARDGTGK